MMDYVTVVSGLPSGHPRKDEVEAELRSTFAVVAGGPWRITLKPRLTAVPTAEDGLDEWTVEAAGAESVLSAVLSELRQLIPRVTALTAES